MRRVPSSLVLAVRDMALLAVPGFAACVLVTGLAFRRDLAEFVALRGWAYTEFSWDQTLDPSRDWTLGVLAWVFVVWCATRACAGRRAAWLPWTLASLVVAIRAAALLAPGDVRTALAIESWPGPWVPLVWHDDGSAELVPGHPAWAYLPLVIGLLAAAAWRGARAGRRPDDAATRRVTPPPRAGWALAGVVVGLPALGGVAGATVAALATTDSPWSTAADDLLWFVHDHALPLILALAAAALLSGTGTLGGLATVIVAFPVITAPVMSWMSGGPNALLGQAAGLAVAVLAVALWRPAAEWGAEVLGPARVPQPGSLPE